LTELGSQEASKQAACKTARYWHILPDHQDYFEILTMVDSEKLPGCQDLRAYMSPRVSHTAVTAAQFENTMLNHVPRR